MTLTQMIWQTVNRGQLTPEQLQDEIDYSASSLKRAGIDGESGAGFNIQKLIPLMKAQNDFSILEFLAHNCDYMLVKIPRGGKSKKDHMISINDYQKLASTTIDILLRFTDHKAYQEDAEEILHKMLKSTAEIMEDIKKGNQIELDFRG